MGDIKLFRLAGAAVEELPGGAYPVEKSLQTLIERNCEAMLGVRFLASEHSTGSNHGGRIDTLGIDENDAPVIIEYKRALNENVINQGLFYLDWLMDHQADFTLLVQRQLGHEAAEDIDWKGTRLLCIAGDFTKYDEHAVKQIRRNIELLRYRRFSDDLLLLELVNASTADVSSSTSSSSASRSKTSSVPSTAANLLRSADTELTDRYERLKAFLMAFGDDVQFKELKTYFAFKRIKNFACVEVHPQSREILVYVKIDPDSIELEEGFTRDVRNVGHFGTGDLEIRVRSDEDLERAFPWCQRSYEAS